MNYEFKIMRMKKLKFLLLIGICLMAFVSCKSTSTASFYNHETECLDVEDDGSQTLKVWGSGNTRADAVEQAKKNAVRDVIFKAHFVGNGGCFDKPLLLEVNAQEKYEAYFNTFFKDGGEYRRFVSLKDERISSRINRKAVSNKDAMTYSIVLRVLRTNLKQKLTEDGILKQ